MELYKRRFLSLLTYNMKNNFYKTVTFDQSPYNYITTHTSKYVGPKYDMHSTINYRIYIIRTQKKNYLEINKDVSLFSSQHIPNARSSQTLLTIFILIVHYSVHALLFSPLYFLVVFFFIYKD